MHKVLKVLVAAGALVFGVSYIRPFGTTGSAAAITGCDLYLRMHTGLSLASWRGGDKAFTASYLSNTTRLYVKVSSENCAWKIDRLRAKTADWLTAKVVSGNPQRADGSYVGSGYFDLVATRNTGLARNTTIYFTTSPAGGSASYDYARIVQGSIRDYCQPKPTVIGNTQSSIVEPGFLVLTNYGQSSGTPPAKVEYRFRDAANCSTSGTVVASTPNLKTPSTQVLREAVPDKFLFRHLGVLLQPAGGAALARLGDSLSIWQGRSAVFVRYLLRQEALPLDLRIDPLIFTQYIVAVSDGGGVVQIRGHAVRSTSNPSRPCAFNPAHYRIVEEKKEGTGTQWFKLIAGTGCDVGKPDEGTLMISVYPSAPGVSRLGAFYTDWGSAILIVQR